MTTESRLRDLMATYREAVEDAHGSTASTGPQALAPRRSRSRRRSNRPFLVATALAAAAVVVVVGLAVTTTHNAIRTGVAAGSGVAARTVDPTVVAYVDAFRSDYNAAYTASEKWWYSPPEAMCRQAALEWTDATRQECRADLQAAVDAAHALAQRLGQLAPPAAAATAHHQLVTTTDALQLRFDAQLTAERNGNRQAFLDASGPISVTLGDLCPTVTALNQVISAPLPLGGSWCGQ